MQSKRATASLVFVDFSRLSRPELKHHMPQRRVEMSLSWEAESGLHSQPVAEEEEVLCEPLPEPLLIILSPPPAFLPAPGEPSMSWPKWLKAFQQYVEALGEQQLVDSSKCMLLQNCLGPEGQRLYSSLVQNSTSYTAAVSALSLHFSCSQAARASGIHEVSVVIGEDLDPPVEKRKRGRPRRGEGRPTGAQAAVSQPPPPGETELCDGHAATRQTRSMRRRSARSRAIREREPLAPPQPLEEEGSDWMEEEEGDEDFVDSSSKLRGPYCPVCPDRRFRNAHKLARHMRTHTKEKPFRCPVCALAFSQSYHMTRHMRNQHGAGPYVCPACGDSFDSSQELQQHKRSHRSDAGTLSTGQEKVPDSHDAPGHVSVQSRTEGQRSPERSDKNQETAQSGDEADSKAENDSDSGSCDAQDREWDASVGTQERSAAEAASPDQGGQEEKSKAKAHCCPICVGRHFRGPNKLARHMRTHTKEKPFRCLVCTKTFSQSYHMTRHLRKQHEMGSYICSKCGKSARSWLQLSAHKRAHAGQDLLCLGCEKQLKEKATLITHFKQPKRPRGGPRSLACEHCGKVFRRRYHLKRHLVRHAKEGAEQYTCPDCLRVFAFPLDLNRHLQVHSKENNGICPKCDQVLGSREELDAHMKVHNKSYACSTCGKKFKVEYALKKHEQGHQNEQFYCSLCNKYFFKLSHYKRHVLVHNRRESRCPHCDAVFLKLTAFKYHLRTHTEERPHQCPCCIETFEAQAELEQHRLKHRKFKAERPYSCTRCSQAFLTLAELTRHMSCHEGEQPQSCPVCGKTFLNQAKLQKHLSIHSGERPHLCSICGNGFPSAASLKLHAHMHTGEKPFKCQQCSKSFSSSSSLRLHSRQHMEVRPSYECPECGRSYGRITELKMHQRYHTGDKPYACIYCSKCFISKHKLNVHMRVHTGERPYSCPHCGQTFTQTGDRNRHVAKYH